MSLPIEALEAELLRLSTADRLRLLDRLIASLDLEKVRDDAWDKVAARRDNELASGKVGAIPGPEVLARLRAEILDL